MVICKCMCPGKDASSLLIRHRRTTDIHMLCLEKKFLYKATKIDTRVSLHIILIMSTAAAIDCWNDICTAGLKGDDEATELFLFVGNTRVETNSNNQLVYTNVLPKYKEKLLQLGFQPSANDDSVWTLPKEVFPILYGVIAVNRSSFHRNLQVVANKRLEKSLREVKPLVLSHGNRLSLFREFVLSNDENSGALSLYKGLAGFLRYQLKEKQFTAEWNMGQYTITQSSPDFVEQSIRLLRGVLDLQLLYRDDDDSVAIDMPDYSPPTTEEPILVWRISPHFDNKMITDFLRCIPRNWETGQSGKSYQSSTVERIPLPSSPPQGPQILIQWFYKMLSHCLSFLQK